jgi:hypothetical protein
MATVHNQVWNQYINIIKTEKTLANRPQVDPSGKIPERASDTQASKSSHPSKGRYVDLII